ncbi:MAG: hypothetical protein PHQ43_01220 [Dehalococcoidales bacterium]|nr:hypothetical protein [Dehalococcoidales bacterium]
MGTIKRGSLKIIPELLPLSDFLLLFYPVFTGYYQLKGQPGIKRGKGGPSHGNMGRRYQAA